MIYDVIIIGGGASGLFSGICLDKNIKKLILEKTDKLGMKVLLSGGERANVTNMNIDPLNDYFSQNKKFLLSIFSKFSQWDTMGFFAENGINLIEEDRGRMILESGNSKELLNLLIQKVKKNNCEIKYEKNIVDLEKKQDYFELTTEKSEKFKSKNVIISSGGKTFFHVGTTGEGYNFAEKLGLNVISTYRALSSLTTKKDLSSISGISSNLSLKLIDKINNKKIIYSEKGPVLFTHFGLSGPCIYNISNAIGEYLNSLKIKEEDFEKYLLENMYIELEFDLDNSIKKVINFFELSDEKLKVNLELQNWRSWKEAKVTGGGIDTLEFDNHLQVKKYNGLYFVGEVVDITGKTGGYNLQWAWSSSFVACENINKN